MNAALALHDLVWCGLKLFGVIRIFDDYRCFMVRFGIDLVRIHSVWFVSPLFGSRWVYLVWFGVVWCDLYCNNWCSLVWVGCGLVRNHLVWFGRNRFDFVWFDVICNPLAIIDVFFGWILVWLVWLGDWTNPSVMVENNALCPNRYTKRTFALHHKEIHKGWLIY